MANFTNSLTSNCLRHVSVPVRQIADILILDLGINGWKQPDFWFLYQEKGTLLKFSSYLVFNTSSKSATFPPIDPRLL
ncbi:hypothetical protein, partial [Desulfobacula sp.]|uniref:hypothetical protein n=1 Tax=Desulfobacula sp. TaxID=2593537 RepID=UPI0025B89A94